MYVSVKTAKRLWKYKRWREWQKAHVPRGTELYPDTDDLLDGLEALGYKGIMVSHIKGSFVCFANKTAGNGFVSDTQEGRGPNRAEAVAACLLAVLKAGKEAEDAKQAKP